MKVTAFYCGDDCKLRFFIFDENEKLIERLESVEKINKSYPQFNLNTIEYVSNGNHTFEF